MSRRTQSPAEAYGAPQLKSSAPQHVHCSRCGTEIVFTFDMLGRMREKCPQCDGVAKRRQPVAPYLPQLALTNARPPEAPIGELLPAIAPGQLRCQRCARGVESKTGRYCQACVRACRSAGMRGHPVAPETRAKMRSAMIVRATLWQLAPTTCACGQAFTPTHPRQRWCAQRCPARPPRYKRSTGGPMRTCVCGATFVGKQGKRFCTPDCPARRAS